jgi:2-methylcitrate dehydratase PrpD
MNLRIVKTESKLIQICRRPIAEGVLQRARFTLLDWMGCAIAARRTPVACAMAQARDATGNDLLRMGFASTQADAQSAALALGTLGNVLEMDDLHRASILHPGDATCAAALAVALRQPTSGEALLSSLIRGYEAAIRVSIAAATAGYTPFYNSGTCGVFGAAIAAADLKGLDAEGMADALGQAGMQAAGVWQCRLEPTFSKQLACAHAARAGVFSAELAAAGFPGARAILTGELGFFASYYPKADRSALTAPGAWAITETSFKPFAACRHTHPAISAMLELRQKNLSSAVECIDVYTYRAALDFCDQPTPQTSEEARFSLQHAVVMAFLKGAPAISDFDGSALNEPVVVFLRARVHLHVDVAHNDAFPREYGARVRVTLQDGQMHEAICPAAWGDPENPMSEADLIAKFRANAIHGGLAINAADGIIRAVLDLPDAQDLSALQTAFTIALPPELEFVSCP